MKKKKKKAGHALPRRSLIKVKYKVHRIYDIGIVKFIF